MRKSPKPAKIPVAGKGGTGIPGTRTPTNPERMMRMPRPMTGRPDFMAYACVTGHPSGSFTDHTAISKTALGNGMFPWIFLFHPPISNPSRTPQKNSCLCLFSHS